VAACAKHFPGHGDTSQDSHLTLPRLPHPLARLEAVELPPFTALARAGVAAVMTAHVVFEPLDPERPATLSAAVLRLLRERCGFDRACLSDDLEMGAIADRLAIEQSAPGALVAGVDQLLVCRTAALQHRAIDAVRGALEDGRLPAARLAEATARVAQLLRWAGPPPEPRAARAALRTDAHLALAARLGGAGWLAARPLRDPTG
jgi:beta-N-acetylhexosaminidase